MSRHKDVSELIESLRRELPVLRQRYRIESLEIFGSYIREEHGPDSDLDLLVTFSEAPSLLKFIEMENYLSDMLGLKIDLVMKDALKPELGKVILSEAVTI
jgi:uncharacterized protein